MDGSSSSSSSGSIAWDIGSGIDKIGSDIDRDRVCKNEDVDADGDGSTMSFSSFPRSLSCSFSFESAGTTRSTGSAALLRRLVIDMGKPNSVVERITSDNMSNNMSVRCSSSIIFSNSNSSVISSSEISVIEVDYECRDLPILKKGAASGYVQFDAEDFLALQEHCVSSASHVDIAHAGLACDACDDKTKLANTVAAGESREERSDYDVAVRFGAIGARDEYAWETCDEDEDDEEKHDNIHSYGTCHQSKVGQISSIFRRNDTNNGTSGRTNEGHSGGGGGGGSGGCVYRFGDRVDNDADQDDDDEDDSIMMAWLDDLDEPKDRYCDDKLAANSHGHVDRSAVTSDHLACRAVPVNDDRIHDYASSVASASPVCRYTNFPSSRAVPGGERVVLVPFAGRVLKEGPGGRRQWAYSRQLRMVPVSQLPGRGYPARESRSRRYYEQVSYSRGYVDRAYACGFGDQPFYTRRHDEEPYSRAHDEYPYTYPYHPEAYRRYGYAD